LCSAPSTGGSASRFICAASSLPAYDNGGAKGMSTTTKIVLIASLVGGILLVLGLICFINLRTIMTTVTNTILSNRSDQNINVNIDSDAKAVATSDATSLALSDARATATSNADAQADLEQRWVHVNGQWQLLHGKWIVKIVDGPEGQRVFPALLPRAPVIEEIE
jgi:hypothetical protein